MKQLTDYILYLADNSLIAGHRNSEWTGHGPVLEQDIAITNLALDQIGQARLFYQYAASVIGGGETEDSLAYLRTETDYKNCLLVELPKGDWAFSTLRQFLLCTYQYYLYRQLSKGKDPTLAAIAEKGIKEISYHVRWSGEWVVRLGDGTAESHRRMQKSLKDLWEYSGELFIPAPFEEAIEAADMGINLSSLKKEWLQQVTKVMEEATLTIPADGGWMQTGGKEGRHTEHLGYLLAEMQYLQRTYPNCEW
jgi:ring-1,2-phenylacetyl-CoA epoxidase subunit PaaC